MNTLGDGLSKKRLSKENFKWSLMKLSLILQPFVPHISEEIWSFVGDNSLCVNQRWPVEEIKSELNLKLAIQINGKTKEIIEINSNFEKDDVMKIIKENKRVKKNLLGKEIIREIYVPGKIVNLVIK